MDGEGKKSENERRDWIIILVILLFGFLCLLAAGERAIHFAPTWKLSTNMRSNLDPNSDFLTNRPVGYYEPLDPSILTQPSWFNVILTPGAIIETRTPSSPSNATNTPIATNTLVPSVGSPTATVFNPVTSTPTVISPSPTNTLIYYPPPLNTSTSTPKPPPATNTPITPSAPPPTVVSVDLGITKTDGVTTYTAGSTVTYTIVATNNSTNSVTGATISDTKPAQVTTWGWCAGTCTPTTFNGNNIINIALNLGPGASATYTIQANISPAATGDLSNTATISVPSGYTDTNGANDSFNDTDTLVVVPINADIAVSKISSTSTYVPGGTVTYTVTISNNGPNNANGVTLVDAKPASIVSWTWSCVQNNGAAGCDTVTNSNADFNDVVNLPNGASITYTVSATISGTATGSLQNNVTRTVPAGVNDTNATNDSDSYTHTWTAPSIDLEIFKDDGSPTYSPGDVIIYTITVTNNGTATASGFNITDTLPLLFPTSLSASCVPSSGSDSCGINGTAGTTVAYNGARLSPGQTLTVTINMGVSLWEVNSLSNTANIVIPSGANFSDPDLTNNSNTDIDTATQPICDATIDVPGTGSFAITAGNVTCLRFTDPSLIDGATISVTNSTSSWIRWNGKEADDLTTACGVWQGLLWIISPSGNTLSNIYIDRETDIILYAQALGANDTLTFTSITSWVGGCP